MGSDLFVDIYKKFPALEQKAYGERLVYFDSAATALKPAPVIECLEHFYKYEAANVHRGAHYLSHKATEKFEASRNKVKNFIHAKSDREIVFTSGTTDSINLIARLFASKYMQPGDEILLSEMEHHSNIVPWQMVAKELNLVIKWIPVDENGELIFSEFEKLLNPKTKIVSIVHSSNVLGTVNPIEKMISRAHDVGAKVMIDAAQSISFMPIDVQKMDCDFLTFSGHKLYGPYGIGILYGKLNLLEELTPFRGGGSMVNQVTKPETTYLSSPNKFEAGTPNISGAIGLGAAIDFVTELGLENIHRHAQGLLLLTTELLSNLKSIRFIGTSSTRVNIQSFMMTGVHPSDVAQLLDRQGVALRAGHHCAQILMSKFEIPGTIRVSFGVYNTSKDIEVLLAALKKAEGILL